MKLQIWLFTSLIGTIKIPDVIIGSGDTVTKWTGHAMSKLGRWFSDSANCCQTRMRSRDLRQAFSLSWKIGNTEVKIIFIKLTDFWNLALAKPQLVTATRCLQAVRWQFLYVRGWGMRTVFTKGHLARNAFVALKKDRFMQIWWKGRRE